MDNKLVGLRKYGYQILIREYGKNPEQAGTLHVMLEKH